MAHSGHIRPDDPIATPAFLVREDARRAVTNQSTRVQESQRSALAASGFDFDDAGRIPSLAGIDAAVPGAPTLRDVAARLPMYEPLLSEQQVRYLDDLQEALTPFRAAFDEVAAAESKITGRASTMDIGSRPDVMDGGFYIPRGNAETPELADIALQRGRTGGGRPGRSGFERASVFESEAAGIEAGFKYTPVPEALGSYVKGIGNRTLDRHVANYLATRTDEAGNRLATAVAGAPNPRARGTIPLRGLEGQSFPWEMADEATRILNSEAPDTGVSAGLVALNSLMRGIGATGELSMLGIQGSVSLASGNQSWRKAASAAIRAWTNGGDRVLGDHFRQFDAARALDGRPTLEQWGAAGGHLGGSATEFSLTGRAQLPDVVRRGATRLSNIPVAGPAGRAATTIPARADRGFGTFGDVLRTELWDTLAEESLAAGRKLDAAEMRNIVQTGNRVSGWSPVRAFGSVGEALNFAPRFLAARFEAIAQLGSGSVRQRQLARRMMGRYIGTATLMTMVINEINGEGTDFRPFSGSKGPTWNPLDAEYKNPNFVRARNVLGRDWSLLGPVDSALGIAVGAASLLTNPTADPQEALSRLRTVLSGPLASLGLDWLVFGESFGGEALNTPKALARDLLTRVVPFALPDVIGSALEAVKSADEGEPVQAAGEAAGGLLQAVFGFRGSPTSTTEQLTAAGNQQFDDRKDFFDRPPSEQQAILDANPDIAEKRSKEKIKRGGPSGEYEEAKQRYAEQQLESDERLRAGDPRFGLPQWVDDYRNRQSDLAAIGSHLFGDDIRGGDQPRDLYFGKIRENTRPDGTVDWD
ncbi:MAG TPA: hypothetical protein VFH61_11865, partial [Thermoleophilia bacterium]|nr:hypothetical protein [Thermoleophilia bacterium]